MNGIKIDKKRGLNLAIAVGMLFNLILFPIYGQAEENYKKSIVFLGDSLTAGYGINPELAYPALIQKKVEAESLPYTVVAAGLSGDTTAGGLRRVQWILRKPVDIFILALGANDGLRGLDLQQSERNLQLIIDAVKEKNPDVTLIIAGMLMPPNLGQDYSQRFSAMFPSIAQANKAALIPFLLEGVAGEKDLNQSDRIHPNAKGHARIADLVWSQLKPLLQPKNIE